MNLPSYNTEKNNSNNVNNKRIPKWVIPTIAILGTAPCTLGATGINPIACRRDHF